MLDLPQGEKMPDGLFFMQGRCREGARILCFLMFNVLNVPFVFTFAEG